MRLHLASASCLLWSALSVLGCGETPPSQTADAGVDVDPGPGHPGPRAPTPDAWTALPSAATLTLEVPGMPSRSGAVAARLEAAPPEVGDGAWVLRLVAEDFPAAGARADCRVGLQWYNNLPIYSLNPDPQRTPPCTLRVDGADTALAFSDALVQWDEAGRLTVRLGATASGPRVQGPVTLRVLYPRP